MDAEEILKILDDEIKEVQRRYTKDSISGYTCTAQRYLDELNALYRVQAQILSYAHIKSLDVNEDIFKKQYENFVGLAVCKHQNDVIDWMEGGISKSWIDADGFICVEYESGNAFQYSNVDLPFMSWKELRRDK